MVIRDKMVGKEASEDKVASLVLYSSLGINGHTLVSQEQMGKMELLDLKGQEESMGNIVMVLC